MIVDARKVDNSAVIESDICIIGGGAAGISIALQFGATKNASVVLLESGPETLHPATQAMNGGEQIGIAYDDLAASRSRYLGGATNCWGGWCRAMDEWDFQERDWAPNSGWPFGKSELLPYYERSHEVLDLKPYDYDLEHWLTLFNQNDLAPLPLGGSRLANMIVHLSAPARFGKLYGDALRQAANVKVMLMANATEICTDRTGATVQEVKVATLSGKRFSVRSKLVVLAAGAVENARLLLLSSQANPKGLGNANDLVGRYFMDHPRMRSSRVRMKDPTRHRRLYDSHMAARRGDKHDIRISLHMAPTEETQRTLRIPNSRTYLMSRYADEMSDGYLALRRLAKLARGVARFGYPLGDLARELARDVPTVVVNAPGAVMGALGVVGVRFNSNTVQRDFTFESVIEPIPNPDSRVTLSEKRDKLGLNTVIVDWRLTELDREHFKTLHRLLLADGLSPDGLELDGEPADTDATFPGEVAGCWHHMGTTRMHRDPKKGVVDADCRVHGMSNLFIAGSSVFPTVGSDTPTITIVALALRLCGALNAALRSTAPQMAQL